MATIFVARMYEVEGGASSSLYYGPPGDGGREIVQAVTMIFAG